jgi:hypothetical protein
MDGEIRVLLEIFPVVVVENILEKLTTIYRNEHKLKLYKSIKCLTPDTILDSCLSVFEYMSIFPQVSGNVKIRLRVHNIVLLSRKQVYMQQKIRDEYLEKLYEDHFE